MTFIPEWVSFQSKVRTAFTCYNRTAQPKVLTLVCRFSRQIGNPCAVRPRLLDLQFSLRNEVRFQFTWYQNEISYQDENFIRNENWNELIPEWLVLVRYHENNYRVIHGDGMNSFQNESHFSIKWIAPYPFIHLEITHFFEVVFRVYSVLLVVLQIRCNFCVFLGELLALHAHLVLPYAHLKDVKITVVL